MFVEYKLSSGKLARIVVSQRTIERLATTCFRGREIHCAGNFHRWIGVDFLLEDDCILRHLLEEIEAVAQEETNADSHSVTIEHHSFVGWESTDNRKNYTADVLEEFHPNRHSTALRVLESRRDLLAPQTKDVTIVFDFHFERHVPTIVIGSIYPGQDVGVLDGDVTARENRVFFDWDHPGEN